MTRRIAVVDVGTNSTRLLVADVAADGTALSEVVRRSHVTRLGEGVDATGRLAAAATERVHGVLDEYGALIEQAGAEQSVAVLTSAVRDADDGSAFAAAVRERHALDARELSGAQEARLTYLGATWGRARTPTLVVDVGGGSTELVIGEGETLRFHASTQAGVVRQTERHLAHDPPADHELQALTDDVRRIYAAAVPHAMTYVPEAAIAVAGTATSLAAIELALDPYDARRVEGHVLERGTGEMLIARLAGMTLAERRALPGLHPDRAPVIVAGAVLLVEALRLFRLQRAEVSEHDLLYGTALACAAHGPTG